MTQKKRKIEISTNPLAEVFGFPYNVHDTEAKRHRQSKLCPFNNVVPSCTKDKASNPLGVCSIHDDRGKAVAITCPERFRQDWVIAGDAAAFFFPKSTRWTSLTEVRITDKNGQLAGNIDVVLVAYSANEKVIDFGAVEIQAVYISGNVRNPFDAYMKNPEVNQDMDLSAMPHSPRPDYLSSSRKRLVPQLLYKGGILRSWGKKMVVVLHRGFFQTLPTFRQVSPAEADIAWLIYDLDRTSRANQYSLVLKKKVYTKFNTALKRITTPKAGDVNAFLDELQRKLESKMESSAPTTKTILDLMEEQE